MIFRSVGVALALAVLGGGSAGAQTGAAATAAIEAKSLSAPMAALQRDSVGPVELVLRLSNDEKEPMSVGLPALVETSRKQGGVTVQADPAATRPRIVCGATVYTRAPVPLAAGAQCQARLTLDVGQPGEYKARVAVTDVGGAAALADVTANVRACFWWVIAIALAGTAIGWFLKHWTTVGRPRLLLLERLYQATAAWNVVDTKADERGLGGVTAGVGSRLAELGQPGGLSEKDATELTNIAARVRRFASWIALEIESSDVANDPGVQAAALAARTALRAPVNATDDTAADVQIGIALNTFAQAIAAAAPPQGAAAKRRAAATFTASTRDYSSSEIPTPGERASLWRQWGDVVVAFVTAGLIAASAIELVWLPNAAWGGLGDGLKLFFGAVAAQAGALAAVDAFRGKFPTA